MRQTLICLFCTRYQRPRDRRAAEQRYEITPFWLIELHALLLAVECVTQ